MYTVLVVDDDECFQYLCETVFKRSGESFKVLSAYDGLEALELLSKTDQAVDLILLDINMPRMNGHEFLEKYQEIHPGDVPVVAMLTSSDQQADRRNALSYSFVKDYLLKPLRKEDIQRLKVIFDDVQAAC